MTREDAKELLPIIQAYAEGKVIQMKDSGDGGWYDMTGLIKFDGLPDIYRIKPFENHHRYSEGAESRDSIAFMAMQGLCSNPAYAEATYEEIANMAYGYADAMIKESKK